MELTKQESQFIINAVDAHVRAQGLSVAQAAVVVCAKMQSHIQALDTPAPVPPKPSEADKK